MGHGRLIPLGTRSLKYKFGRIPVEVLITWVYGFVSNYINDLYIFYRILSVKVTRLSGHLTCQNRGVYFGPSLEYH